MCMGFGCNAAGVVGCRIIDSKRERLIAMLTNALVPCNGRFPTLIALISMFFVGAQMGSWGAALILSAFILCSVLATLVLSKLLSQSILKGDASAFALELPPYRKPEFGKVIVRSVFDRTLFVLGRAVAVAAPAGLILWILANVHVQGEGLLQLISCTVDPIGRIFGLDGVILIAFLLALPANEIVIPVMLMAYTATGSLNDYGSLDQLKMILIQNGWTHITALCTVVFMLFHFPCSTTLLTIKKESGGARWALWAALLPTVLGLLLCFVIATVARLFLY